MRLTSLKLSAPFLLLLLMARPGAAQRERNGETLRSEFQVSAGLVLVPVTVTDHRGAYVGGLDKDSFTVLDDRRPQPITAFFFEDSPCSVGLVVDASGSVKERLDWEKEAVHSFLELANPEDDFFVATVSTAPTVLGRPTADLREIEDQVRAVKAGGWTALYDTIHVAAERLKTSRQTCRALVVLSDGIDNHSRLTRYELMQYLMESDIQVYVLGVESTKAGAKAIELADSRRGAAFLDDLALNTGGVSVAALESQSPGGAAHRISTALRNRYVIGFLAPDGDSSDKWHTIRVKIDRSRLNVYARAGYKAR